jgi:ribosomal protein S24E
MESKIITQTKNPFLEREEITIEIKNPTTPTYDEVKEAIGKDAGLTIVKKINTNFGRQTFVAEAVVYNNAEAKKHVEVIPQKVKKKMEAEEKTAAEAKAKEEKAAAEAKAAEEAAAAEPTPEAEAPTEEKTEEPKPEEAPAEEPKAEEKAE